MNMAQKCILLITTAFSIVTIVHIFCDKNHSGERKGRYYFPRWKKAVPNITCHNSHKSLNNDTLPSVEDKSFNPKSKSIFFHETSCRGGVDSRQACAVESAARANPDWEVYLLFNAPVSDAMLKKSCLVKLLQYSNVRLARIHAASFSKESAVQQIVRSKLPHSRYPVEHSADIMRMLTLHRWGGLSLDLDMLVAKSFNNLPKNWIVKETIKELSTGAMAFSREGIGHNFTGEVLKEMSKKYDNKSWSGNSPLIIQNVLRRYCNRTVDKYGFCNGVNIFRHDMFYPIHYASTASYFEAKPLNLTYEPYTYHLWNALTEIYDVHPNSTYARLARKYCPKIYRMYATSFGV
ncbi:lactosylceramide 4-alpha-galactosyltransferase-like [Helicoverpa zea]|uniref:lactosylceramide 4-alpha-galactosyltransferase-like n=1 Tax=Helicoverpa zea TaxID=7113 RepID=UPI001F55F528|nr:lactosylceramide 4-alpha-galactosyltransferase-like [Helicoverpa zea]